MQSFDNLHTDGMLSFNSPSTLNILLKFHLHTLQDVVPYYLELSQNLRLNTLSFSSNSSSGSSSSLSLSFNTRILQFEGAIHCLRLDHEPPRQRGVAECFARLEFFSLFCDFDMSTDLPSTFTFAFFLGSLGRI